MRKLKEVAALELRSALLDKAENVPLFLEEVTKALLDLGMLRREGGRMVLGRSMADVNVPDTILPHAQLRNLTGSA